MTTEFETIDMPGKPAQTIELRGVLPRSHWLSIAEVTWRRMGMGRAGVAHMRVGVFLVTSINFEANSESVFGRSEARCRAKGR